MNQEEAPRFHEPVYGSAVETILAYWRYQQMMHLRDAGKSLEDCSPRLFDGKAGLLILNEFDATTEVT